MTVTTLSSPADDQAALAAIGATAFGDTEVLLLQQLFIALAAA